MKKCFYLLMIVMCLSIISKANPGDTTWVQANNTQLTAPANFDTAITFPNTGVTYRKIIMVFTLGKYVCPNNPQYCGSWDYIVNNYIMTPGGDTMEIARLITPYATTSTYFPNSWTYDYVFDVTDYASLLKSAATVRIGYGGYSYGFTANVRFAFIEGTPDRNVTGIQRLWHGSFVYGVASNPITNYVSQHSINVPASTVTSDLKMRITGHGEDSLDCNEFCDHTYDVLLDNNDIHTQDFFRTTCGVNPVYSQTGTWPFDRSNWCPGALVYDIYNPLAITSGTHNVDVTFPPYVSGTSNSGNSVATYDIEAAAIYYGAMNKTLDASLEEILAPNDLPQYSRTNNVCGEPMIHVHNSGSATITSLSINYGVADSAIHNYTWNGSLAPLQDIDITLPSPGIELQANSGLSVVSQFTATIVQVNGQTDGDATNNTVTSFFKPTPVWAQNQVLVKMTTSTAIQGPAQTWQIMDMNDNVVAQRVNTNQQQAYIDTVNLNYNACYKLVITDPDGVGFLPGYYFSGVDEGSFAVTKIGLPPVNMPLPNYHGGDIGSGITQYFFVSQWPAGVTNITTSNTPLSIEAYPNPAQNSVTINITGFQQVDGTAKLIDMLGRTVLQRQCTNSQETLDVSNLANGVYTIVYFDASAPGSKLQTRLLIAK